MDKHKLLEKVNTLDKNNFDKSKLVAWITCLEGAVKKITPIIYKKGDVLMHPIFYTHIFYYTKKVMNGSAVYLHQNLPVLK